MGDSGIAVQLTLLVLFLIVTAIVAFVVAWRVRNRVVRVFVGVLLLAMAAGCILFSTMAVLLVAALGIIALVMGAKTPQDNQPRGRMRNEESEKRDAWQPNKAAIGSDIRPSLPTKTRKT